MSAAASTDALLHTLRDAGAARLDAVGWHYIEVLAERTRTQTGPAQVLLSQKLHRALTDVQTRMANAPAAPVLAPGASPSPLALLLQEMTPPVNRPSATAAVPQWSGESPRVRQFRKQLRRISVQKQVSQAIAQAPVNAGPINSHMLVLRALGVMRDISPDYLNRFMSHVDTLLCLDEAEKLKALPRKAPKAGKAVKAA